MVVAYASLGLVGYLVYRLGSLWFDRWIGAVAALIVLTRAPYPLQRPARLRRPPLHRPLPRRPGDRGQAAAGRLAGPGPAGPGRPAAPRGLALRRRLLALPGARFEARAKASCASRCAESASPQALAWLAALGLGRADPLGAVRRDHHRQPALLADRHPGNGRNAETPDRAGRPRPLRPAPARRSPAVAGDGRRRRRRRPRLRLPAPALGARRRRRGPRPRRLRPARLRRPGDHRPLHDARRGDPGDLRRRSPCSAGGCWSPGTRGGGAGRSSPAWSR